MKLVAAPLGRHSVADCIGVFGVRLHSLLSVGLTSALVADTAWRHGCPSRLSVAVARVARPESCRTAAVSEVRALSSRAAEKPLLSIQTDWKGGNALTRITTFRVTRRRNPGIRRVLGLSRTRGQLKYPCNTKHCDTTQTTDNIYRGELNDSLSTHTHPRESWSHLLRETADEMQTGLSCLGIIHECGATLPEQATSAQEI